MAKAPPESMKRTVRSNLVKKLQLSGLLEYGCRRSDCKTQVFATWEVDLTCNVCSQPLRYVTTI